MDHREAFEREGAEHVRLKIAARQYNDEIKRQAVDWLAEQDARSLQEAKAAKKVEMRLAIANVVIAMIGAIAAVIAAIAAF